MHGLEETKVDIARGVGAGESNCNISSSQVTVSEPQNITYLWFSNQILENRMKS